MVHGDIQMVMMMSQARGMNGGEGYSYSYVRKCLSEVSKENKRHNAEIKALHQQLIALRTPKPRRNK